MNRAPGWSGIAIGGVLLGLYLLGFGAWVVLILAVSAVAAGVAYVIGRVRAGDRAELMGGLLAAVVMTFLTAGAWLAFVR